MTRSICPSLLPLASVTAQAQQNQGRVVKIRSASTHSAPAERMRVQIEIFAQGENVGLAAGELASLTSLARKQVASWKAVPESIVCSRPGVATHRFMPSEASLALQMSLIPVAADEASEPASELQLRPIVSSTLTADFELPTSADGTSELTFAEQLKDQMEAADLSGVGRLDANVGCRQCGTMPGVPLVQFIRRISAEERAAVTGQLLAKAKREAESFALAAGMRLGEVSVIEPFEANAADELLPSLGASGQLLDIDEASSAFPGRISHGLVAQVTFELLNDRSDSQILKSARR